MGLGKKSKRDTVSSSRWESVEQSSRFTCNANRLDRAVTSRKHTFSAEHAEQLMKKHVRKKTSPVKIACLEDRIAFHYDGASHAPKHARPYAKYADIRHIFIYSLSPCLFMLCVEDSEKKNKKYYESFRCQTAEDVNRLCELTATAKQNPNNHLPPIVPGTLSPDGSAGPEEVEESNYDNPEPATKNAQAAAEAKPRDYDAPLSTEAYAPSGPSEYEPAKTAATYSAEPYSPKPREKHSAYEHSPGGIQSPALAPVQNRPILKTPMTPPVETPQVIKSVHEPMRSPPVKIADSRRQSQTGMNRTPMMNAGTPNRHHSDNSKRRCVGQGPLYRTYRTVHRRATYSEPEYRRDEVIRLFGDDLTFVTSDSEGGAIMCQSGSVFLYAVRMPSRSSSRLDYGDDDYQDDKEIILDSPSHWPQTQTVW